MSFKMTCTGLDVEGLYLIKDKDDNVLEARYRTTSAGKANAVGNNCGSSPVHAMYRNHPTKGKYRHMITKVYANYSVFYESIVISEAVDNDYLFTTSEKVVEDVYSYLMNKFKLPLLYEWAPYLYGELCNQGVVEDVYRPYVIEYGVKPEDVSIIHGERTLTLAQLKVVSVAGISDTLLRSVVTDGLRNGKIFLDQEGHRIMPPLQVEGMDDYTVKFGASLCEHLEAEKIRPKSKVLKKDVDGLALLSRRLYAPQAASVNGIVAAMFEGDKYIFVSEEMGCGKTIQAAAAVEAYYNQKWLNAHPGKSMKDCFLSGEVKYRVAVLCPSHLCVKWKAEVESQVPGAIGILVTTMEQLAELRKRPRKERTGKEFFIFSKEFAKADTYKRPVPTRIVTKIPVVNLCYDCLAGSADEKNESHKRIMAKREPWTKNELSNTYLARNPMFIEDGVPTCISCGGHNAHLMELDYLEQVGEDNFTNYHTGLCCPSCDNLLIKTSRAVYKGDVEEFGKKYVMGPEAFASKCEGNERCTVCGSSLWEDNVQPLNIPLVGKPSPVEEKVCFVDEHGIPHFEEAPKKGWCKIKYTGDYAKAKLKDKKKRLNKSGFALRGHEQELIDERGVGVEFEYADREYGPRRFPPARYVKRYLKGYFDILIADEAHLYEGEKTNQAMAAHWLSGSVKFSMFLTGTLTNGTAASLFDIHFMVNPGRMRSLGFAYDSESREKFNEAYGVTEEKRSVDLNSNGTYSAQGRGKALGGVKVKPGISPMIYPDLLVDHTVQLNIGDMSNKLPPLNEFVEEIPMNEEQYAGYKGIIQDIRDAMNTPPVGAGLMGQMLQLGLSYVDKPYGRGDIWSLKVPDYRITEPYDLVYYKNPENLLPKEERLVEIVNKEISEGRNVFIYTEYSGNEETDIDGRLMQIVERHCNLAGQVKVLKSKDVKPVDRELYIKKNSDKYKVWITNYRNVETGIDFIGEYEGRKFNYPTIVFFQIGMSLSSVWQASRRHYRLNQTEECRTYYLVYKGTFQKDMLEMMSKKMSAASAIQGNFSESALENMAGSEDPAVVLAKKILAGNTGGEEGIDVASALAETRRLAIEACDESIYVGNEPVTFYEVMGDEADKALTSTFSVEAMSDMSEAAVSVSVESMGDEFAECSEEELLAGIFDFFAEVAVMKVMEPKKGIKKSLRPMMGQMTLFG